MTIEDLNKRIAAIEAKLGMSERFNLSKEIERIVREASVKDLIDAGLLSKPAFDPVKPDHYPHLGREIFVIAHTGLIVEDKWNGNDVYRQSFDQGNIYLTRAEAERRVALDNLKVKLKRMSTFSGEQAEFACCRLYYEKNEEVKIWFSSHDEKDEVIASLTDEELELLDSKPV